MSYKKGILLLLTITTLNQNRRELFIWERYEGHEHVRKGTKYLILSIRHHAPDRQSPHENGLVFLSNKKLDALAKVDGLADHKDRFKISRKFWSLLQILGIFGKVKKIKKFWNILDIWGNFYNYI